MKKTDIIPFVFCRWLGPADDIRILIIKNCKVDDYSLIGEVVYSLNTARAIGFTASVYMSWWKCDRYKSLEELMAVHWEDML